MTAEAPATLQTYLVFKLGPKEYGFESRFLWEAAVSSSFTEVPLNESHLIGVTQLHGKIIPVLDMAGILGISVDPPSGGFVTMNLPGISEMLAGFAVDEVMGFIKVPDSEYQGEENELEGLDLPYLKGWAGSGKKLPILDMERLIRDQVEGGLGVEGLKQRDSTQLL